MTPPETLTRQRVKSVYASVFATEIANNGWPASPADDKLPRGDLAGQGGKVRAAVYPERAYENPRNVTELICPVILQLYLPYEAEPNEYIVVDPGIVEGYAERLRVAFNDNSSGNLPELWFVRLTAVEYPDDPTGNKSRLEARIEGHAQNRAGSPSGGP